MAKDDQKILNAFDLRLNMPRNYDFFFHRLIASKWNDEHRYLFCFTVIFFFLENDEKKRFELHARFLPKAHSDPGISDIFFHRV